MYANQIRQTNSINQIMDYQGSLITDQSMIGDLFTGFFYELFTSSNLSDIDKCLTGLETRVTADMNATLLPEFIALEVKEAVFQMSPLSSPRPDGFPSQFY